ncbi:6064_t:CDS:10 [Acaulospora morrowiae]|uniref:Pheromone-processing carboxypeptidase KEX1 n=1 Tax=Acaulospora morrowiae TaxID=94023 RepID=A0A9N9GUE2_9GLOM|nr:6064_t:CDS:10 [Acaulospora morrowiae]
MKFNLKSLVLSLGLATTIFTKIAYAASAADYFVRSLPGLPDNSNTKSHAGHILIDESTHSNIFFWLMHNRHIADRSKLIIWLNGGPGCSSMDGVFLESGPWRINSDQTLRPNEGSWNEYANVLYVDQPVGTGFSFADSNSYLTNVTQVPGQFLLFLDKFFEIFPEYSKDDMYITGESFAGTYIPYIASAILQRNHARKTADYLKYNLKGIAIGNGWIDPITQYNAYYTFSVDHNLLTGEYKKLAQDQLKLCMDTEKANTTIHLDICEQVLLTVLESSRVRVGANETCINQYDIRDHSDSYPSCGISWPYELTTVYAYLRRADVVGAIHADAQKIGWVECNTGVSRGFTNDLSTPAVQLLPSILKQIDVLLYSGDQDLICNHNGTEDMIAELTWNGAKGFQNLTATPWFVNNSLAGHILSERNLTYVLIYNASHMVPYDAPVASMDMIYRFIGLNNQNMSKFPSSVGYPSDNTVTTQPAQPDSSNNNKSDEDSEAWDRYYNAGTATLIIVICGALCLGLFVCRGRLRRFIKNKNQQMKSVVENGSDEMEEFVIETPSEEVDHFGDSEDEDDGIHNSRIRKNQTERYVDVEDEEEERMRLKSNENL